MKNYKVSDLKFIKEGFSIFDNNKKNLINDIYTTSGFQNTLSANFSKIKVKFQYFYKYNYILLIIIYYNSQLLTTIQI
jgi:hypothetical protein